MKARDVMTPNVVTVTADMTGPGGISAVQASAVFELDLVDTLVIDNPIAGDDRVNAAELAALFPLGGTSEVETGQTVHQTAPIARNEAKTRGSQTTQTRELA